MHRKWIKHAAQQQYLYEHQFFIPIYGPPQYSPEEINSIRKFRTWLSTNTWLIEGLDPENPEHQTELDQRLSNLNKAPTTPDWYERQLQIIEEMIGTDEQDLTNEGLEEEIQSDFLNNPEENLRQNNTLDESSEEN